MTIGKTILEEVNTWNTQSGMVVTNAGDWNVDFFRENGYSVRGELKDVPKGHNCYELCKMI